MPFTKSMSSAPPYPPEATSAQQALVLGALLSLAPAAMAVVNWVSYGASLDTLGMSVAGILVAFAIGIGIRAGGTVVVRSSERASIRMLSDLALYAVGTIIWAVVGRAHDSSGSVGLAIFCAVLVGIPIVAVCSLVTSGVTHVRWLRVVLFAFLFAVGVLGAVGFGASMWS